MYKHLENSNSIILTRKAKIFDFSLKKNRKFSGPRGHGESAAPGSRMAQEEEYLSNIFKYIGFFMLFWLLFV